MTDHTAIPVAAVLGDPVAHSRSPALHGHWLARHGVAGHYIPLRVPQGGLPAALGCLARLGFAGANVTIPHKEAALALANTASDRARRIGAANLLTFGPGGATHADNTDGAGFLAGLQAAVPEWRPRAGPALVLGAGGAARAIVDALAAAGVAEIRIANRTRARAVALACAAGPVAKVVDWDAAPPSIGAAALLVNTTSLGMTGQPPLTLDLARLDPAAVVADIVYSPLETDLLRAARQRGCRTVDGLAMLLHQAVPAFEAFFGPRPSVDEALRRAILAV
jgi:shikimate dehydrogenase